MNPNEMPSDNTRIAEFENRLSRGAFILLGLTVSGVAAYELLRKKLPDQPAGEDLDLPSSSTPQPRNKSQPATESLRSDNPLEKGFDESLITPQVIEANTTDNRTLLATIDNETGYSIELDPEKLLAVLGWLEINLPATSPDKTKIIFEDQDNDQSLYPDPNLDVSEPYVNVLRLNLHNIVSQASDLTRNKQLNPFDHDFHTCLTILFCANYVNALLASSKNITGKGDVVADAQTYLNYLILAPSEASITFEQFPPQFPEEHPTEPNDHAA